MTGRFTVMIATAGLAACGSMANDGYHGEPLAKLQGTVESHLDNPPADVGAAVIWMPSSTYMLEHGDGRVWNMATAAGFGTLVDVTGSFPASFAITLYEPPPELALEARSAARRDALGKVVAVDRAKVVDNGDGTVDVRGALIGSTDQIDDGFATTQLHVVFNEGDDDTEDPGAQLPWSSAGYHLVRETQGSLTCNFFMSDQDCIDTSRPAMPNVSDEALLEFCHAPHQVSGMQEEVALATSLVISLAGAPLYMAQEPEGGFYDPAKVPTCP
jgi:hypothetical protein